MDAAALQEENAQLKAQLHKFQRERDAARQEFDSKVAAERGRSLEHADQVQQKSVELEGMKQNMVNLARQLDDEVSRRDQMQSESASLERRVQELSSASQVALQPVRPRSRAEEDDMAVRERGAHVSTKLMRVVDQWMRQRDLQQALLRGASINDVSFATLVQALSECQSLQTLDLSANLLTMDSCSDLCQLIATSPNLSFVSVAGNLLSLRSIGYLMTAVMERQSSKRLMPLDLLDLQGNEGLVSALSAPAPDSLVKVVRTTLASGYGKVPAAGAELTAQVMRALWRFLHDTGHPQVRDANPDEIAFHLMDKITLRKMEAALTKMLLLPAEDGSQRPVTASLALFCQMEQDRSLIQAGCVPGGPGQLASGQQRSALASGASAVPAGHGSVLPQVGRSAMQQDLHDLGSANVEPDRPHRDIFGDLKEAFEAPKDKLKTFNLKQIVTRGGTILMNMLERLLESTEIDAVDVETEQTLLEYSCVTGNMGLAKLCYRRGAKLSARTKKGDTAFNIVTKNRRYDMMEFLHTYGVKVNSCDKDGATAMHCAAQKDDVDAICRLVEWGADANTRDRGRRTPIHVACAAGNSRAAMLLLEVGADMNAKDDNLYTAAAHANMNSHFQLFDRLTALGGRRHEQIRTTELARTSLATTAGQLVVSAGMLKSTSLGRIGKIKVNGMSGPIRPTLELAKK